MKNNIFNFYRKKQPENTPKAERTTRTKKVHITRKTSTFAKLALTFLFVIVLLFAVASIAGVLIIRDAASTLPSVEEMTHYEPDLSTIVYDRNEKVITRLFHENRTWVPLSQIPIEVQEACIAAEDSSFYSHRGWTLSVS